MKLSTFLLLGGLCFWSLALLVFRSIYWNSHNYFFLPCNLLLAAIPLSLSQFLQTRTARNEKWLIGLVWLLFFPNAPYILTDLVHLSHKRAAPFAYDLMLLLSFAGAGAAIGFVSLRQMQNVLIENGFKRLSLVFAIATLFLASFGIYLGRVVRLNSWDVLLRPFHSLNAIASPFLNPSEHLATWSMTVGLGVSLSLAYLFFAEFHLSSKREA